MLELYSSFNEEIVSVAESGKVINAVVKAVPITIAFCQQSLLDRFWFEGLV